MNDNTTYEQLIAQKLEQLSVPDNADAIWAAIEKQLDIVMPVDTPAPAPVAKVVVKPGIIITAVVVIIIAAIVVVRMFSNPNKTIVPPIEKTLPVKPLNKPVDSNKADAPIKAEAGKTNKTTSIVLPPVDTSIMYKATPLPVVIDKKDSVYDKPLAGKRIIPDSIVIPKKNRGVTGISDDDYRIVPKDSLPQQ